MFVSVVYWTAGLKPAAASFWFFYLCAFTMAMFFLVRGAASALTHTAWRPFARCGSVDHDRCVSIPTHHCRC